jgi:diacylglycerol kinase (ATP)
VLLNLGAGVANRPVTPESLAAMAREIELDVRIEAFTSGRQVQETARQLIAAGEKTIIVGGGDGTIAGVAREAAHTDVTIGVLPAGSANNFASALNIPMSIPAALSIVKGGLVRGVSLGKVEYGNEFRYFTESAGTGLFADAFALYGEGADGLSGTLKGLGAALQLLKDFRPHHLRMTLDDAPNPIETEAVVCAVANAYRMGTFFPMAPTASLTDDVFDIVLLGDLTRAELLQYYQALMAGTHFELPKVTTFRAKRVRLETDEEIPLNVHADDTAVTTTPATVTLQPNALKVLVGSEVRDDL